jgi:hypothetical protein
MPSPFDITAVTPTIPLDNQRRGKASYTVRNISAQPIRGLAQLVALEPTRIDWLTLVGEAEREFSATGTQQYTVDIQVGLGAAAGSYTFRLDMVGVQNPDELYSQGQLVTFQVPEVPPPPPPPPPKKGYLRTAVGAVIGGLAAGTLAVIVSGMVHNSVVEGVITLALYAILSALGAWVALNMENYDWARETAVVLGVVLAVLALVFSVLLPDQSTPRLILTLVAFPLGPVVVGLIARAIILRWKMGTL